MAGAAAAAPSGAAAAGIAGVGGVGGEGDTRPSAALERAMMAATSSLVLSEDDVLDCSVSRGEDAEEEVDQRAAMIPRQWQLQTVKGSESHHERPTVHKLRILPACPSASSPSQRSASSVLG